MGTGASTQKPAAGESKAHQPARPQAATMSPACQRGIVDVEDSSNSVSSECLSSPLGGNHGDAYDAQTAPRAPTDIEATAMVREYQRQQVCEDSDDFDVVFATISQLAIDLYIRRVMACCICVRHTALTQAEGCSHRTLWESLLKDFGALFPRQWPDEHDQAVYVYNSILMGDLHFCRCQALDPARSVVVEQEPITHRLVKKFCAPYDPSGSVAKEVWETLAVDGVITKKRLIEDFEIFTSAFRTRRFGA